MSENVEKKSGLLTAGFVLGIIAICTSFIPIVNNLSFIMGILAIIFAIASIKKGKRSKIIITIVLGVLAIAITIQMQKSVSEAIDQVGKEVNKNLDDALGNNTQEILKNNVDVLIGEFKIEKETYITNTELSVNVKNKSTEQKSFSIQIEAVDNTGSRIELDYIYANNLGAGQTQEFKIFTFVSSEKINSLKNATFKIVQVSM